MRGWYCYGRLGRLVHQWLLVLRACPGAQIDSEPFLPNKRMCFQELTSASLFDLLVRIPARALDYQVRCMLQILLLVSKLIGPFMAMKKVVPVAIDNN